VDEIDIRTRVNSAFIRDSRQRRRVKNFQRIRLGAQAKAMTQLTAEIQAHNQMFKMMQETMTTKIKTIGEALKGTVRKQ